MGRTDATPSALDPGARAGELFEAHGRMVYALCRMILRDGVEAEDAAQQTFLSAYRSLLNGRGPDQPEPWLATIARNECHNRIARRPPTPVPLLESDGTGAPDPARVADTRAEFEALCSAVAELPARQREAIVLREFYGLSYREVAAALGMTGSAVESAIFKSRRSLQERLRPMRDAAGSLALPLSLQDALAHAIPGFSQTAAGGSGASIVAKLGVPFGVKALVAGLSVVAVGGTLATKDAGKHDAPRVFRVPLHSLATQPAEAAAPRARTAPVRVRAIHATSMAHTSFVAASTVAPKPPATHENDGAAQDDSSVGQHGDDDRGSAQDTTEERSTVVAAEHDAAEHDNSATGVERQQADDSRDAAEHAADAARDVADAARGAQAD